MAVPASRILALTKVQTSVFNTVFNPERLRLGTKILRQRLRGPAFAAYYPRKVATFRDLRREYPGFEILDDEEEDRLEHVQITKSRGKAPPKKKRTKEVKKPGQKKK